LKIDGVFVQVDLARKEKKNRKKWKNISTFSLVCSIWIIFPLFPVDKKPGTNGVRKTKNVFGNI
jgi:hypothetical protein